MNRPIYTDLSTSDYQTYFFRSVGRHVEILKAVVYSPLTVGELWNLGLATVKTDTEGNYYLDGEDRTNNGDINKVLSTVAKTVEIFLTIFPQRKVYFNGYFQELTNIYQRAIRANYDEIITNYHIWGDREVSENVYDFEPFNLSAQYYGFKVEKQINL